MDMVQTATKPDKGNISPPEHKVAGVAVKN